MRFCLLLAGVTAFAQQLNFVACPVVRDTKTVPCFLAEYEGELYYLGIQQDITSDFHPPQLKHEVLVEGTVAAGPRVCGGIPLKPLSISVIKEVNLACNTLLPAEPGIEAPPAARGAGPATHPLDISSAKPKELTGPQEFTILYSFNDDFLEYAGNRVVNEAIDYAKRTGASSVKVTGYRESTVLSNGTRLVEKDAIAEKRAENIAALLRGSGVSGVSISSKDEPESGPAARRVAVVVTP
ncbi:MAG: hypothetical protein JO307_11335 [Bryobacterales bacterium]|nr:hypothetical protein [Bryobacterales bacterium]MBV9400767.1 hypothetical protein [Bryobacterales bacterium]